MAGISLSGQSKQRQIVILAVGSVALGGLLLFQVPRTLERLNPPAPTSTQATQTAPAPTTPQPATPPAAPVVPVATAAPRRNVAALSRFKSKDPFVQQVDPTAEADAPAPAAPAPAAPAPVAPRPAASPPAAPSRATATTRATADTKRASFRVVSSATISVNGIAEKVSVTGTFPKKDPVFRLVSLNKGTAKIGIAGGTLTGGSETVTLTKGEPLTLLNTVDGKRYKLELK